MATKYDSYNSIHSGCAAACTSNLVLPLVVDAAAILVVSVLVCLRVILLGM